MSNKYEFKRRTLDDPVIRDSLMAINSLEDSPMSKGLSYAVGGVATQGYLPSSCRRPTSDIDLAVVRPLSYSEFKQFAEPAITWLGDNGYDDIDTVKGRQAYKLIFSDSETGTSGLIEFSRRSQTKFDEMRSRLERELGNTRLKKIEEREGTWRVSSPEDIVVPKLLRSLGAVERQPELRIYFSDKPLKRLNDGDLGVLMGRIDELRTEAETHIGDVEVCGRLRFVSDLYDVRLLGEVAGLNEAYFNSSINSWDSFKGANESDLSNLMALLPTVSLA